MTSKQWDPAAEPYRVSIIYSTNAPGCHGWASRIVGTYPDEVSARAVFDAPQRGQTISIDKHVLAPGTPGGWLWQRVARRKIGRKARPLAG